MNVNDSEKIAGIFLEAGYEQTSEVREADVIVLNTCSVRQKAEQKLYSNLGRLKAIKRKNPHLKIAVAGCIAQHKGEEMFKRFQYVDFIFGPQNIDNLKKWIPVPDVAGQGLVKHSTALNDNPEYYLKNLPIKREGRVSAWVSIMYGCNNFCSYCVVPYTRGREVSRPSSSILAEIKELHKNGYKEVTLLGQNVNSYRSDCDFTELLRRIDRINIERIRFVTSHPRDLSVDLIKAMNNLTGLCEHLHLPIQSGSDRILKLMNRRYTYRDFIEKVKMLKKTVPGIAITTDIIAGFPGEDDDDYQCTVKALEEIEFDGIYAFKYSPRKGTKAYEMENNVPEEIKTERLSNILRIQEEITCKKNKKLEGTVQEILVEGLSVTDKNMLTGRTRTNKIVTIINSHEKEGSLINVKINKARQHSLHGVNIELEPVKA